VTLELEPRLWGTCSIPDAHLRALAHVTGKRVLELGCGADPCPFLARVVVDGDQAVPALRCPAV